MKTETIEKLLNLTLEEKTDGLWLSSDGELYIGLINKPDNFTGEHKAWHFNRQLWVHFLYENDRFHGEGKAWYPNGQLYIHSFYENGKLIKDYLK